MTHICCLNPACYNPQCPDDTKFCPNCGVPLVILRNRYRPIKPLGGGGFGKTYLAEDIDKLNQKCVIKQFAPQVQGTAALQKATELFEQEAKRLEQLGEHPQIPTLLAYFQADGQTLVSGSSDKTIKIWNLQTGKLKSILTGYSGSVAISPDGQTLVSGSEDGTIKIWYLETGQLKSTLIGHSDSVNSVAISPDGQTLVSGSEDKTIKIWNLETGQLKSTLTGHSHIVDSVAINPDGRTLVSGSWDGTIKIWQIP